MLKKGAVYTLVAVSMNLLNGFTGLFSLGQAGFKMCIRDRRWGDYTLTLLDYREGPGLALQPGPEWEHVSVAPCDPGARLTLPGERGGRTVKRLCLDRHISLSERDRLPALYLGDRLAAVWDLGVDTEFAPEGTPCRFIQIKKETEENHHEK